MLELITLGRIECRDPVGGDVAAVLQARKPFAVFLYLVVGQKGNFCSRDLLQAMFWPDASQSRARNNLNQVLHRLREALGDDVVMSRGSSHVAANMSLIRCDAVELSADRRPPSRELAELYQGEFLPGFFIRGAADFENWLDLERNKLRRIGAEQAWQAALAAERDADAAEVGEWVRRAVELYDDDETAIQAAIELLDRIGNRSGAIRVFEAFEGRLSSQYEVDAAPETLALMDRVRSRIDSLAVLYVPAVGTLTASRAVELPQVAVPAEIPHGLSKSRSGAWTRMAVILILGLSIVGFWRFKPSKDLSAISGSERVRIVVHPLTDNTASSGLQYLVAPINDALLQQLSGIQGVEVVSAADSQALESGTNPVSFAVKGTLVGSGNTIRVSVRLIDRQTGGTVRSGSAEREDSELLVLVDDLSRTVATFLRAELGKEVHLRTWRAGTSNAIAWDLVQRAEDRRYNAKALHGNAAISASINALEKADSLLGLAQGADPEWSEPLIRRAYVAHDAAWFNLLPPIANPLAARKSFERGLAYAERATKLPNGGVAAKEIRGTLAYWVWLMSPHNDTSLALLRSASRDLRQVIETNPRRAQAWRILSAALQAEGQFAEAYWSAERAYAADSYMEGTQELLARLFTNAFEVGDIASADRWCKEIDVRYPKSWLSPYCHLADLAWRDSMPKDAAAQALRILKDNKDPTPLNADAYPKLKLLAATVLARSGQTSGAEDLTRAARESRPSDPELLVLEAGVRIALAQPDSARRLLARYVAVNPAGRAGILNSRRFVSLKRSMPR